MDHVSGSWLPVEMVDWPAVRFWRLSSVLGRGALDMGIPNKIVGYAFLPGARLLGHGTRCWDIRLHLEDGGILFFK